MLQSEDFLVMLLAYIKSSLANQIHVCRDWVVILNDQMCFKILHEILHGCILMCFF